MGTTTSSPTTVLTNPIPLGRADQCVDVESRSPMLWATERSTSTEHHIPYRFTPHKHADLCVRVRD